jgi:hypothetical protein
MHTMPSHNWDQRLARATAFGRDLSDMLVAPGTLPRRQHARCVRTDQHLKNASVHPEGGRYGAITLNPRLLPGQINRIAPSCAARATLTLGAVRPDLPW